jgi:CBS domain-containing protein
MKITQIMSKNVHVCRPTDTLERAAELMWEHDIGALPVVDQVGRAIGMITDRDACMASYTRGEPLKNLPVSVAMSHQVVTCHPDDSYSDVAILMSKRKIRRVPVVDLKQRPIGIVSLSDLALAMARRPRSPRRSRRSASTVPARRSSTPTQMTVSARRPVKVLTAHRERSTHAVLRLRP